MRGTHPHSLAWASWRLHVAFWRLGWEILRALKINRLYGIPDKRRPDGI